MVKAFRDNWQRAVVRFIANRDGFYCHYCYAGFAKPPYSESPDLIQVDHIVPPTNAKEFSDPSNLVLACSACNSYKGAGEYSKGVLFGARQRLARIGIHYDDPAYGDRLLKIIRLRIPEFVPKERQGISREILEEIVKQVAEELGVGPMPTRGRYNKSVDPQDSDNAQSVSAFSRKFADGFMRRQQRSLGDED